MPKHLREKLQKNNMTEKTSFLVRLRLLGETFYVYFLVIFMTLVNPADSSVSLCRKTFCQIIHNSPSHKKTYNEAESHAVKIRNGEFQLS